MSNLFRWTLIVFTPLGLLLALYFLATNFFMSVSGAAIGIVLATLYVGLVVWLLSRSRMWPAPDGAGWRWVAASLVWGSGVSLGIVAISGLPIMELTEKLGWDAVAASFGGAYPEEIAKALGVGVILFVFRGLNRPWHGLLTGALVGLGFEAIENALYGSMGSLLSPTSDVSGALEIWFARIVTGPGLHIIFSALAGWGLGLAIFSARRSTAWRYSVAGSWLFVAFLLHFLWNIMWPENWMFLANYVAVALMMYPLFVWVWLRARRAYKADDTYSFTPRPVTVLPVALMKQSADK